MTDILHRLSIDAEPRDLYDAVSDPKQLAAWWTHEVAGKSEVGQRLRFFFDKATLEMEVAQLVPGERVVWRFASGMDSWAGTEIEFAIARESDGTVLRFAHRGWRDTSGGFAMINTHWAGYLISLKSLVETGKGAPFPSREPIYRRV